MVADGTETSVPGGAGVVEAPKRHLRPLATLMIALVAASVHVAVNGYSFGGCTERLPAASPSGDHANILPWVYWHQDDSLFPHDPQIQSGASYATVLWRIVALCGRAIQLPYVFFVFHILALIGTYAALFCLGQLLGGNAWAGGMACALFVVACDAPAGEATHDPAFYTRMAALPLVLASVYGALRARPILAFATLTASVAVHLLTAFYAAPIVLGLWMFASGPSRQTRALWAAGFVCAAIGIAFMIGGGAGIRLGRPGDEWLDLQRGNNVMHLFPSHWPREVWRGMNRATVFLLISLVRGTTPQLRRFSLIVIMSCVVLALAGWLFAEKWPSMLIMQLQPLRGLKLGMILALVAGGAWLCRSQLPITRVTAMGCLIAWVGQYYTAFLFVLAVGLFYRFVFKNEVTRFSRNLGNTLVALGGCFVIGLLVRNTVERVELKDGQFQYRYRPSLDLPWRVVTSPWVDVQRWIAINTPTDAYFVTPPILEGFRTYSRRSEFADWKQGTLSLFHERFGTEWLRRLARLMGPSGGPLTYLDLYNRYNGLNESEFRSLAAEYGLTHAVTMKPVQGLTLLHRNQVFIVYQLR